MSAYHCRFARVFCRPVHVVVFRQVFCKTRYSDFKDKPLLLKELCSPWASTCKHYMSVLREEFEDAMFCSVYSSMYTCIVLSRLTEGKKLHLEPWEVFQNHVGSGFSSMFLSTVLALAICTKYEVSQEHQFLTSDVIRRYKQKLDFSLLSALAPVDWLTDGLTPRGARKGPTPRP